jgi:hypothetical protein
MEMQRIIKILTRMEADDKAWRREMKAERKAYREDLKRTMEEMMITNQAKTDVMLKELTETIEKTHLECEETTSADRKACQETTVCHEATEADIEKIEPD